MTSRFPNEPNYSGKKYPLVLGLNQSPIINKKTSLNYSFQTTDPKSQVRICEDILNAITSQDQAKVGREIKRLSSTLLRGGFQKLSTEYFDIKYRKNQLVFKVDSLNSLLNKLASLQLIDPQQARINGDNIKQLDIYALKKVVQLTNQSKIMSFIIDGKSKYFKTPDFLKYIENIKYVNCLKSMLSDLEFFNKNRHEIRKESSKKEQSFSGKQSQIEKLKRENTLLTKKLKQIQGQKEDFKGIYITQLNQTGGQDTIKREKSTAKVSTKPETYLNLRKQQMASQNQIKELKEKVKEIEQKYYELKLKSEQEQKQALRTRQLLSNAQQKLKNEAIETAKVRSNFTMDVDHYNTRLQKMNHNLTTLQNNYNQALNQKKDLEAKNKLLDDHLFKLQNENKSILGTKLALEQKIGQLQRAQLTNERQAKNRLESLEKNEATLRQKEKLLQSKEKLLHENQKNIKKLKQSNQDQSIQIDGLVKQIQSKSKEIQELRQQKQKLLKETNDLHDDLKTKIRQTQRLSTDNNKLEIKNKQLSENITGLTQKIQAQSEQYSLRQQDTEFQLSNQKVERSKIQSKHQQLKRSHDDLEAQSKQLKKKLADLQSQNKQQKYANQQLARKNKQLEAMANSSIKSVNDLIRQKQKQLNQAEERIKIAEIHHQEEKSELERKISEQILLKEAAIERTKTVAGKFQNTTKQNKQLQQKCQAMGNDLQATKLQLQRLKKVNQNQQLKKNDEITEKNRIFDQLKQQKQDLMKQISKLNADLQANSSTLSAKEDQLIKVLYNMEQLQKKLADEESNCRKMIDGLNHQLHRQQEGANANIQALKVELENEKNQNINLVLKLQTAEEKAKDLQSKNKVLEQNVQQLKDQSSKECQIPKDRQYSVDQPQFVLLGESLDQDSNIVNEERQARIEQLEKNLEALSKKCAEEQAQNNKFAEQNYYLQSELSSIKQSFERKEQEYKQIQIKLLQQVKNQSNNLEKRQIESGYLKEQLNIVKKQLNQANAQINDKQKIQKELLNKIQQFEEKDRLKLSNQAKIQSQAKIHDNQVQKLTSKLRNSQVQLESIKAQVDHLLNQLQQSNRAKDQQAQKNQQLLIQNHQLTAKCKAILQQLQQIKRENKSLKDDIEASDRRMQQDIEMHRNDIQDIQARLKDQNYKLAERQAVIKRLKDQIEQKNQQIQQINKQLSDANKQEKFGDLLDKMADMNKQIISQQNQLKQSEKERKILSDDVNRLTESNRNYEETIEKLNDEFEKCKKNTTDVLEEKEKELVRVKLENEIRIVELQAEIAKQKKGIKKLEETLDFEKKKNLQLEDLFYKLTEDNEKLEKQKIQKEKQLEMKNAEMMIKQMEDMQAIQDKLQGKNASLIEQIILLKQENQKIQEENKKNQQQIQKIRSLPPDDRQKLLNKIKKYEEQIDELNHQVEVLNQTLEEITKFNQSIDAKELDEESRKIETEQFIDKLRQSRHREVNEKDEKIDQLTRKLQEFKEQLKKSEEKAINAEIKNYSLQQEIQAFKIKEMELNFALSEKIEFVRILDEQKQKIAQEHSEQIHFYKQQLQKIQYRASLLEKDLALRMKDIDILSSLFQNQLLQYFPQHKKFLKNTIEDRMNCRILKSRLIYRYDPASKVNFHTYIDGKENLVLIIKLKNGFFVASYTEDSFQPKKVSQGDGLIISLTNQQVFTLIQPNRRAIAYDEYYILFGNSQLRLKSQENKLFSNFGINNSYYAARGFRVSTLLGGANNQREIPIENYEIYQLELIHEL